MDGFLSLAKEGYSAYSASQQKSSNSGNNSGPQFNHDEIAHRAGQDSSEDPNVYHKAMEHVNDNQHAHNDEVDEGEVQDAHDKAYNQGGASGLSAQSMGGAAAMQILKKFTSGGGSSGGGSKSELISLAMSEASKLFDKSGGAASGNKQDAVNGAAMTVVKLLVQSKASSFMGGGDSGGMGSLMGLASKFM